MSKSVYLDLRARIHDAPSPAAAVQLGVGVGNNAAVMDALWLLRDAVQELLIPARIDAAVKFAESYSLSYDEMFEMLGRGVKLEQTKAKSTQ